MVDAALDHLKGQIEETGAVVTCDPLPEVNLEGTLLMQLFQNLIENAVKYRGKDVPRIHIGAGQERGCDFFSVRDNGVGIPEHQKERIFEPFKRLHGHKISGSGIGLAICKKIVERAGGRIWVESEPGKGSTFFFTLSQVRGTAPVS
jgi:signal transduction histidine kinase